MNTASLADGSVTTAKIADGSIGNADISSAAGIAVSKLSGVAGVEFTSVPSRSDIPTSGTNLAALTVSCPTSGYVVLRLTASAIFFADSTNLEFGFGTTPAGMELYANRVGRLDGSGTQRYREALSAVHATSCNGTTVFYAVAKKSEVFDAGTVSLDSGFFVASFYPNRY